MVNECHGNCGNGPPSVPLLITTFFLVHTSLTLPDCEQSKLDALRDKEKLVAHDFQRAGTLLALWREAGQLAAYGIWSGQNRDAVENSVARLPFRSFMALKITELSDRPYAAGGHHEKRLEHTVCA